jgi:hypothetical protein
MMKPSADQSETQHCFAPDHSRRRFVVPTRVRPGKQAFM